VMLVQNQERYLVSMLGEQAYWVRNLRAAGGKSTLRYGRTEQVLLVDVPVEERAPLLKVYLQIAPGAWPHVLVDKDAPLDEFERVTATYPMYKVNPKLPPQTPVSQNIPHKE